MKQSAKIAFFIFLAAILGGISIAAAFYAPLDREKLNWVQRYGIDEINQRLTECVGALPKEKQKTVSYGEVFKCLDDRQKNLARRIFAIKPDELGFKGPSFSMAGVSDLVQISEIKLAYKNKEISTGVNFLPRNVSDDFQKMTSDMKKQINKTIYVSSGYRSPGYQAKLFLYYLGPENGYSLFENAKWIAMPGYSEHNSPNTAIDFINQDGISGQDEGQTAEEFEKLTEFEWLQNNAAKYNFYLTYPKNNPFGVSYEPWHWHWEKN